MRRETRIEKMTTGFSSSKILNTSLAIFRFIRPFSSTVRHILMLVQIMKQKIGITLKIIRGLTQIKGSEQLLFKLNIITRRKKQAQLSLAELCHTHDPMKLTLDLDFISSRVFSPCAPQKVPSRHIHLSSIDFSFVHSEHLHRGPPTCPTPASS